MKAPVLTIRQTQHSLHPYLKELAFAVIQNNMVAKVFFSSGTIFFNLSVNISVAIYMTVFLASHFPGFLFS